ncbi:hypothetical protein [Agrococcus sp. Marseille-P2731]|uniref:hypothetical protein n=1 Tax=Agrococcus sp. Marseille-P2731 TaxID=1841862 RepID=UPI000931B06C|nr:hypothetical protein [Agrococcus sp. Marseille-P2731]
MTSRTRSLVGPLVAAAAAAALLAACAGGTPDPTRTPEPVATTAPAVTDEGTPTPEPLETDAPAASESADAESLAEDAWEAVLAHFGGEVPASSPLSAVIATEDISADTIRVHVDDELTDADREEVARLTFELGAADDQALRSVVVRDATGVDSDHER